jgi:hypothetical protein
MAKIFVDKIVVPPRSESIRRFGSISPVGSLETSGVAMGKAGTAGNTSFWNDGRGIFPIPDKGCDSTTRGAILRPGDEGWASLRVTDTTLPGDPLEAVEGVGEGSGAFPGLATYVAGAVLISPAVAPTVPAPGAPGGALMVGLAVTPAPTVILDAEEASCCTRLALSFWTNCGAVLEEPAETPSSMR